MQSDLVEGIAVPDGFKKSFVTRTEYGEKVRVLTLEKKGDTTIEIHLTNDPDTWAMGSGHTNFTTALGMRTFDRLGCDDSFYVDVPEKGKPGVVEAVNAQIVEQLARIVKSRDTLARSEVIPQIGFSVTPERKAECIKLLKAGKSVTFTPSGFGTGYELTTKANRRSYGLEWGSKELAAFFGVPSIFFNRMDCD